jgi:hypothetical protein
MMIQVNDRWRQAAVFKAGRATASGGVTLQRTRTSGRRLVSAIPFW